MSLATCLVTLNTEPLNLTKVAETKVTSVKEDIIPFSLYLPSSKSHSQLDELFI
jgi:hypothetical protein